ncbi:MAG: hypothetical protein J5802_10945 [Butyrivibrio sp.]|nr:hypothetical protein [Butyrivibrio sp.]
MACIRNIDENVEVKIILLSNIEKGSSDFETWIGARLEVDSTTLKLYGDESVNMTLNLFEIKQFEEKLHKLIECADKRNGSRFEFTNLESNFELRMELIAEDEAIEIELWINTANRTSGSIYGYDEGLRFVASIDEVKRFNDSFFKELDNVD